jgi:ATP phosphoribosyltransferase regulatory subunit
MLRLKTGRSLVPIGMSTILPQAARRVRGLEERLLSHLAKRGYEEIILPSFEYLDVLAPGLESSVLEKCFHVADRTTGRMLLLRPDPTAQIARTVAMGLTGSVLPLRLCYRTSVFRHEPEHAGRDREIFQVGAELVGVADAAGDAEIISLMATCLKEAGLRSFMISLGHVGFFQQLLAASGLSAEGRKQAEQAAANKDIPRLEELLNREKVAPSKRRGLLMVPGQYGGPEVLEQGYRLAGRNRSLSAPLDRLGRVYRMLAAACLHEHLLLDLGELRGFDYYDGIVFDVFAEGVGRELGGGGRYDHLIGRFGRELPSTGFAFDVDRLFQVIKPDTSEPVAENGWRGNQTQKPKRETPAQGRMRQ